MKYALSLLQLDDPEVRLMVFDAVHDATGTDGGTDRDFWREAGPARRVTAVENWKRELR